jgi:hypothetical protein
LIYPKKYSALAISVRAGFTARTRSKSTFICVDPSPSAVKIPALLIHGMNQLFSEVTKKRLFRISGENGTELARLAYTLSLWINQS